ncbi:MAG: transcriptional regulator [Treponema sp.]|jgi:hypothetical protein|nr:transcriptional regulator [Treponema sp.]
MQALASTQTESDFSKARNKAFINSMQHILNPKEASLISLTELKKLLKPAAEVYKGLQVIPLSKIVGSEGRYKDFDNHFFPKNIHLKARWEHVDMAHIQDVILPPVLVYELGGLYFVRDGNHRVSVAKARGEEYIDAEVVSLQSEIKLKPETSLKKMIKQVINYEKRVFYTETNFGDITDCWCLDFTEPGRYDVIYNHILTHKYYINRDKTEEISMPDAIMSWFETVYLPVISVMEAQHVLRKFRHRTESDLYVWIMRYWAELKEKFGDDYSLDEVITHFSRRYGRNFFRSLMNLFEGTVLKKTIEKKSQH